MIQGTCHRSTMTLGLNPSGDVPAVTTDGSRRDDPAARDIPFQGPGSAPAAAAAVRRVHLSRCVGAALRSACPERARRRSSPEHHVAAPRRASRHPPDHRRIGPARIRPQDLQRPRRHRPRGRRPPGGPRWRRRADRARGFRRRRAPRPRPGPRLVEPHRDRGRRSAISISAVARPPRVRSRRQCSRDAGCDQRPAPARQRRAVALDLRSRSPAPRAPT